MYRYSFAWLLFLLFIVPANARHAEHARSYLSPYKHVLTGQIGLGAAVNCFAASTGLEYERFLTKDGRWSATLPVVAYAGSTFGDKYDGDYVTARVSGIYAAPGVRYHLFGNTRRIDFSAGGSLALGRSNREDRYWNDLSASSRRYEDHRLFGAVLAQANMYLHTNHRGIFGAFLTGGYLFSSAATPVSNDQRLFIQFGIRMGGKW